jgi:hypothetical protein
MDVPTARQYIEKARSLYDRKQKCEVYKMKETKIEMETRISRTENSAGEIGAWVKSWVWVPREDIQPNYEEEETEE